MKSVRTTGMTGARLLIAVAAFLVLTDCAVLPVSRSPAASDVNSARRLVVLEFPPAMDDEALQSVFGPDAEKVAPAKLAMDRQKVADSAEAAFRHALVSTDKPLYASAPWVRVHDNDLGPVGKPMGVASLAILRAAHPADLYLRIRVTDYGVTPRAWKTGYVTFEVVTTLGIALFLYVHAVTQPVAGVYLLQEGVEETTEGYAGSWLLNRLSRPVRMEADLVDGKTGNVLWKGADTGLADWKWSHLEDMDASTRQALLESSLQKTVNALVDALAG